MIIKIGCFDYEVKEVDEVIINGSNNYIGSVSYDDLEIKLKNNLNKEIKEQAFLHEIVHTILKYFNLDITENEIIVDSLACGLYSFLKDNYKIDLLGELNKNDE